MPSQGGGNVRPFSDVVEPLSAARVAIDRGASSQALEALRRFRARPAQRDELAALRAMAVLATIDLPLEPDSARSVAARQRGPLQGALLVLTRWAAAHSDDSLAHLLLGRGLLMTGRLEESERALELAARSRVDDPRALNDRAMVLVALRRLPEAELSLAAATRLAPRDAEPWSNLGAVRLARGDARGASEAFLHAVELEPGVARRHSDLGSAYLSQSDTGAAIRSYERASELAPGDGVVLSNLGFALSLADRLDLAESTLRRAVIASPTSVSAWNNLGAVLARRGQRDEARRCFERALGLDAADPRARANLSGL